MLISPKVRGFICTTAHPDGCAKHVKQQADYLLSQTAMSGPKRVLVVGASTGYGLASRLTAAMSCGASTIGVSYEKPAIGKRTASAGWYNTAACEDLCHEKGLYAKSLNGDAFSNELKQQTVDLIQRDWGQVDLLVYSLASPRRTVPSTGETFSSVLKPIGGEYHNKTVDPFNEVVSEVTLAPADQAEIDATVTVMGGDDWQLWVDFLQRNQLLAPGFKTVAYSYIGPSLTHPIYTDGAIGRAKQHVQDTADSLNDALSDIGGAAYCSVNKAVVTQSSAAIPVVPLYISILFKIMREKALHEDCIEQMYRLFHDFLCVDSPELDEQRRIRLDDREMLPEVQAAVAQTWDQVTSDNIRDLTDIEHYQQAFLQLFGFGLAGVDYDKDIDPGVMIASLQEEPA